MRTQIQCVGLLQSLYLCTRVTNVYPDAFIKERETCSTLY